MGKAERQRNRLANAVLSMERGDFRAAEEAARSGLRKTPRDTDLLALFGASLHLQGRFEEAVQPLREAFRLTGAADAGYRLAQCELELARPERAVEALQALLRDHPGLIEAHNLLGIALARLSRHPEAIAVLEAAARDRPEFADTHNNLGNVYFEVSRHEEAAACFSRATLLRPDYARAHANLGHTLRALRRPAEAVSCYERSIALAPGDFRAHNSLGVALADLSRHEEAIACYRRSLAIRPDHAFACYNLAISLRELGRHDEAIECFDKTLALDPGHRHAPGELAWTELGICRWDRYAESSAQLARHVAEGLSIVEPFTFLLVSDDPRAQRLCAERNTADMFPPASQPLRAGARTRRDRIRVAYLSADFREHAVAQLIVQMFELHDRSRFETVGMSYGQNDGSALRHRIERGFDRFVDAQSASDAQAARTLADLEVDIAVELTGYTNNSRMGILALRPAPIQVNYLGYPGTLGAGYIDYIIADEFIIPRDRHGAYSENVVYLPDCYQANDSTKEISDQVPSRAEAGLPSGGFVFCCFNNNYKISPAVFAVWMRLLERIPGSVLWLFRTNPEAERNLRAEAQTRGIDPGRLVFAPRQPLDLHLARHRLADLFLDTLPYNAHTTASDALWAGLPVLTCAGETFASRVAGSLLHAAGLPELVTASLAEYESLATLLASRPAQLLALRERLAQNRTRSALFDSARQTRHIESAYETMWKIRQAGEPPRAFAVQRA